LKLGIWLGCHVRDLLDGLRQTYLALLDRLGFDYAVVDSGDFCCGYPAELLGDLESASRASERALELVKEAGVSRVVTPCPGCYRRLSLSWRSRVQIAHLVQFLAETLSEWRGELNRLEARVAYHDPCDLGRRSGIYEEPRRILESIPGLELVELELNREECTCCGGGGMLFAVEPELSIEIALEKIESEVLPLGVDYLATACPTCFRVLSYAAERAGADVEVVDLAELVYRALAG